MQKLFVELRERLLRAGVAPRHVERYVDELEDHVADLRAEEESSGKAEPEAARAAIERLGPVNDLAEAMISRRELRSWSARAPWATFGVGPVALLAAIYLVACILLWTGWQMFLPGTNSPFVEVHGVSIFYFGLGRMLYRSGPVLVGWAIAALAARQRVGWVWPIAGVTLLALIGGTAQVRAISPAAPGVAGHVHLGLTWGATPEETMGRLACAGTLFLIAAMPYLIWRVRRALVTEG